MDTIPELAKQVEFGGYDVMKAAPTVLRVRSVRGREGRERERESGKVRRRRIKRPVTSGAQRAKIEKECFWDVGFAEQRGVPCATRRRIPRMRPSFLYLRDSWE